ncbi:4Fe-4S domain-containing protein [Anaerotignum propionicum]|jgi:ferredoxin|nr:ferredoxin [Anaerotignum propionicum]
MGCTLCAKNYPTLFIMQGKKAVVKAYDKQALDYEKLQSVIKACPVHAIEYSEQ